MEAFKPLDTSRNLAQWLLEGGRRRRKPAQAALQEPRLVEPEPRPRRAGTRGRWLVYAALTTLAYLQYFWADVLLQVNAIRSLIVFLLVDGGMPPV